MAKPYEEHAGSGMHIHIVCKIIVARTCFLTRKAKIRRAEKNARRNDRSDAVINGVAAPNVNSYRRFQPGMYVPTQARGAITTAPSPCVFHAAIVIIPRGISRGGCRCQPISGDGSVFAGILHGLDNELPLQEEVEATGWNRMAYPSRFARAMPWVVYRE